MNGTSVLVPLPPNPPYYHVMLENNAELLGKAVIIATGVSYRGVDVAGIEKFEGLGVFYSPADVDHVEAGEPVVIVGGGNSAGQAATALAASGHAVHLIVRGDGLAKTMSTYLLDRIEHDPRITVHTQTVVASVHGDRQLESVVINDRLSGDDTEVPTHSLFVMIGADPHTAWLEDTVLRDRRGFIPTGDEISAAVLQHGRALRPAVPRTGRIMNRRQRKEARSPGAQRQDEVRTPRD